MKINELKRIAKENDYAYMHTINSSDDLNYDRYILTRKTGAYGENNITIHGLKANKILIDNGYCDVNDWKMIKAAVEFAETPPDEREEEKKFYAKHRHLVDFFTYDPVYLNYDARNKKIYVYDKKQTDLIQTQFTLKEYEEIKKKFNTDLADFELVEVK